MRSSSSSRTRTASSAVFARISSSARITCLCAIRPEIPSSVPIASYVFPARRRASARWRRSAARTLRWLPCCRFTLNLLCRNFARPFHTSRQLARRRLAEQVLALRPADDGVTQPPLDQLSGGVALRVRIGVLQRRLEDARPGRQPFLDRSVHVRPAPLPLEVHRAELAAWFGFAGAAGNGAVRHGRLGVYGRLDGQCGTQGSSLLPWFPLRGSRFPVPGVRKIEVAEAPWRSWFPTTHPP